MINKKFKFLDAKTSVKELVYESSMNFIYGFIANSITVFIILKWDVLVMMNFLIYYTFVSIVINRDKYSTKVGKYIVFPSSAALGAYLGYKLAFTITNFL
jgi:hypothetical protein